jgi:hypothetical protein
MDKIYMFFDMTRDAGAGDAMELFDATKIPYSLLEITLKIIAHPARSALYKVLFYGY